MTGGRWTQRHRVSRVGVCYDPRTRFVVRPHGLETGLTHPCLGTVTGVFVVERPRVVGITLLGRGTVKHYLLFSQLYTKSYMTGNTFYKVFVIPFCRHRKSGVSQSAMRLRWRVDIRKHVFH